VRLKLTKLAIQTILELTKVLKTWRPIPYHSIPEKGLKVDKSTKYSLYRNRENRDFFVKEKSGVSST
jgi:hypothetical protein